MTPALITGLYELLGDEVRGRYFQRHDSYFDCDFSYFVHMSIFSIVCCYWYFMAYYLSEYAQNMGEYKNLSVPQRRVFRSRGITAHGIRKRFVVLGHEARRALKSPLVH